MRTLPTAAIVIMLGACGGKPVGSKLPRANPAHVGGAAALVAGALTLADPDSAAKRPESDGHNEMKGKKTSGETVPTGVLDRASDGSTLPLCSELPAASKPAAKPADDKSSGKLELIPVPVSNEHQLQTSPRCRNVRPRPEPLPRPKDPKKPKKPAEPDPDEDPDEDPDDDEDKADQDPDDDEDKADQDPDDDEKDE